MRQIAGIGRWRALLAALTALRGWWLTIPGNTRGALWILMSGILFSLMSAMIKVLGVRLDSFQVAFFRALFGMLTVLPFLWGRSLYKLKTRRPVMHLCRGLMGVSAMMCGFYSITHLPLADATALSFTKPLFLVLLSVIFLGEKVRLRRWTATAVGLAGVLIMLRPTGAIEPAALAAIAGALLVSGISILVKKLSATEHPVAMLFYFGAISSSVALIPALVVWRQPTWGELAMLMLVGAVGSMAQSFVIRGFAVAEASAVSSFDYARIIYAAVIGYLAFGELPDHWTLLGAAVIVISTLYIAHREAAVARRAARDRVPATLSTLEVAARTVSGAASATRMVHADRDG